MIINDYSDFGKVIKNCGIKAREADFKKSEPCPYLAYFRTDEELVYIDNKIFCRKVKMAVELYTKINDIKSEPKLEQWFIDNDIVFDKTGRAAVEGENYYETVYEFELIKFEL